MANANQAPEASRGKPRSFARYIARSINKLRLNPTNLPATTIARAISFNKHAIQRVAPTLCSYLYLDGCITADAAASRSDISVEDLSTLFIAAVATASGDLERAGSVIESRITSTSDHTHPVLYQRLAESWLALNRTPDAARVLKQGLRASPIDPLLTRLFADTASRLGEWQQAINAWEKLPASIQHSASVWTATGLMKSYRAAGSAEKALSIAKGRRKADATHAPLLQEIELCRRQLLDWKSCYEAVGAENKTTDQAASGSVTRIGFLYDGDTSLKGRLTGPNLSTKPVRLRVNSLPVATTYCAGTEPDASGGQFSLNCAELLQYFGDGDVIDLVAGHQVLPIIGENTGLIVKCGLPSRMDELQMRLEDGWVFTKTGRLVKGHDDRSKALQISLFNDVVGLVSAKKSKLVFPFYGSLLGLVRDNDFISHDVGGFDALLLCESREPEAVKAEFIDACKLLLQHGYSLSIRDGSALVRRKHGDINFLDLNYGWFTPGGDFEVSYGWRHLPVDSIAAFTSERVGTIAGYTLRIPGNSEDVLEQLYGPHWRIPDQGFSTVSSIKRNAEYLLTVADLATEDVNAS